MLIITILAAAVPMASATAIETYGHLPYQPTGWKGPIFVDGPQVELNGTLESIHAQILKLNPDWKAEDFNIITEKLDVGGIAKRSNRVSYACNSNRWAGADYSALGFGVQYISKFPGVCAQPPNSCGRFSCSYDAAILLCNDQNVELAIPCPLLGQNAQFLKNVCADSQLETSNGQAFYINPSYNVIVKHTDAGKDC